MDYVADVGTGNRADSGQGHRFLSLGAEEIVFRISRTSGASRGADPEDGAAAVTASGLAARHRSDLRLVSPGSSLEWAARPIREDAISEGLQTWFGSL